MDEDTSGTALLVMLLVPLVALAVAAAVLFGARLPSGGGGGTAVRQADQRAAASPAALEEAPSPTGTPFVLRPATYIYTGSTPVPGSPEAAAAATVPCTILRTGTFPNGYRAGDGLLMMIFAQHPECP